VDLQAMGRKRRGQGGSVSYSGHSVGSKKPRKGRRSEMGGGGGDEIVETPEKDQRLSEADSSEDEAEILKRSIKKALEKKLGKKFKDKENDALAKEIQREVLNSLKQEELDAESGEENSKEEEEPLLRSGENDVDVVMRKADSELDEEEEEEDDMKKRIEFRESQEGSDANSSEKEENQQPREMFVESSDEEASDINDTSGFRKDLGSDESDAEDGEVEEGEGEGEEQEQDDDPDLARVMETFELPTTAEEEADDPTTVKKRIQEILGVLGSLGKSAPEGLSRSDLVQQLENDCAKFYGYLPGLIELFLKLFSPSDMVKFLESNEAPRPTVIRTNTLKTKRRELAKALTTRGVSLEPLADWSDVGLKVFESSVPIGATPEYLAGHYMLQSASSFTPVMALDPKLNERILDLASAPGGKTTYISQVMQNTGLIVANDKNKDRINSTVANCARLGCRNIIHTTQDGRDFPKVMGGFDRALLDAPCSGLGVIQRDPSVKLSRSLDDIRTTAKLQKQLLLSAIDSVKHRGGIVVYSTCSISVEENEMVLQYALEKRDVKIVDTGFDIGRPAFIKYQKYRFHPSVKLARRFYPHVHNMDGFFVAKLEKVSAKGSHMLPTPTELEMPSASLKINLEGNGNEDADKKQKRKKTKRKGKVCRT